MRLREDFAAGLDASGYRALAVDLALSIASEEGGLCWQSEPDAEPEPLGAVIRIGSADGRVAALSGSALTSAGGTYLQIPFTLMADLVAIAGEVDLTHVTWVEIEVSAASTPRKVAFDDVRLLP